MPAPPYPIHVYIAGMLASSLVRISHLTITDILNEQPNTATLRVNLTPHSPPTAPFYPPAFDPVAFVTTPLPLLYPAIRRGQPIQIYAGGQAAEQLVFAGEIVTVQQFYEADTPALVAYDLSCIDHTRALNRRKVTQSYLTQSATAIVLDLMASRLADGFTTAHVAPNLPAIAIDFTFEDMNRALTRLANRIGGYWYVDYVKDLHFFLSEPGDSPAPLVVDGEPFADLRYETDLSQVRTRVLVEGAGTTVLTQIPVGESVLPILDPVMFVPSGGQAIIGQQRIAYTGVGQGGAGSLVGPGAQPGSAPSASPTAGTGIESGVHTYAVTFHSAAGESLPSAPATVTLGAVDPPLYAPSAGAPTAGSGPDPGVHYYAVSFVTPAGETPPSGYSGPTTTTQAGGVPKPVATGATLRGVVGNLQAAHAYSYQTTFTTASGETLPGGASNQIHPVLPAGPGQPMQYVGLYDTGNLTPNAQYWYWVSFIVGGLCETPLSLVRSVMLGATHRSVDLLQLAYSSDPRVTGRKIYRTPANVPLEPHLVTTIANNLPSQNYLDTTADGSLGAIRAPTQYIGTVGDQATVSVPTSNDARVTGRKVYRSDDGAPSRFLVTIANNTATQYIDNTVSVSTQPDAPTTDTTGGALTCVVPLYDIPIGPAGVTARKLYRSPVGSVDLKLLVTIANNTAPTYTDTTLDAALGVVAPSVNTTALNRVTLTNVPIGGAGVLTRGLYRTQANHAQLRYLATLGDNTTTTTTDVASDATLGANIPTVDTSGLQQPQGQVPAGATTLPVSGTAAFSPAGGYAIVGNGEQVIRYTGVSPTALTGLPATGPGALTSTVAYNASVTVAPTLTGVTGITRGVIDGQEVHLLVVRDDPDAQASLAAIEGGDGVIEHYLQDRRLSASSATTTADAELALFKQPEIRVHYTTRDPRTQTGKTIAIALPPPTSLSGEFLIQRVQLSRFDVPGLPPLRTVEASSTRFSFEDVLRRLELEVYA